jgi:superfamily II DNA or RNA helicase
MTWQIMRTSSARKELKYQVVKVAVDGEMNHAIARHFERSISTYRDEDRGIAFCRSKHQAAELATLLNVNPYYAVNQDAKLLERNEETKEKWLSGENKVMVSTSILGCGMDYPHIRDVVHQGPSFSMLDQYQEDSRGGRDGEECKATTFVVNNKKYTFPEGPYDLGSQILYDSMGDIRQCRRIRPTLYLDGKSAQCASLPGASFCDYCDSMAMTLPSLNATAMPSQRLPAPVQSSAIQRQFPPQRYSYDDSIP